MIGDVVVAESDRRPAEMLTGLILEDGWEVESIIPRSPAATGGTFSTSYIVVKNGERAFLKALDYVQALQSKDPPRLLEELTTRFNFERDLVRSCQGMKHVVRRILDGTVEVPDAGPMGRVSYLIFELADGDIRSFRALSDRVNVAWALRSLRHVAQGLSQLHRSGVAHQDIKPSNVMTFDGGTLCKIGDLGRASVQGAESPYDDLQVAGDPSYAPPEAFYGFVLSDWGARRKASDLFHPGSLMLFQFTGVNATGALFGELERAFWPAPLGGGWNGPYDDVLIYLRDALGRVACALPGFDDQQLQVNLAMRFRELCEPDPRRRGHPKSHAQRHGDSYSLERYVSHFEALAARAARLVVKVTAP